MTGLQFDVEKSAAGLRIYARLGQEIVGALDLENGGADATARASAALIYVVPRWRGNGIEDALRQCLALHAATASVTMG